MNGKEIIEKDMLAYYEAGMNSVLGLKSPEYAKFCGMRDTVTAMGYRVHIIFECDAPVAIMIEE